MPSEVVTRTYTASIRNYSQVDDDLDSLGFAASKLWNGARWIIDRVWNAIDHIPDEGELKSCERGGEYAVDGTSESQPW